jgi:hypothetical protein
MNNEIIDKWSLIVMAATAIFSWILFWSFSGEPIFSFMAALMSAGMIWMAYIVIRMVYFALRK